MTQLPGGLIDTLSALTRAGLLHWGGRPDNLSAQIGNTVYRFTPGRLTLERFSDDDPPRFIGQTFIEFGAGGTLAQLQDQALVSAGFVAGQSLVDAAVDELRALVERVNRQRSTEPGDIAV